MVDMVEKRSRVAGRSYRPDLATTLAVRSGFRSLRLRPAVSMYSRGMISSTARRQRPSHVKRDRSMNAMEQ